MAIRRGPVHRLVFAIHMHSSEYAQANSFVAVFMVDFSLFSAVLVNCQFYHLKVFLEAKIGKLDYILLVH